MNPYSESFRRTVLKLQNFAFQSSGGSLSDGLSKAKALIYGFVQNQAFIQAVDDVFLMASIIVLASLVPVLFLRNYKKKRGTKSIQCQETRPNEV